MAEISLAGFIAHLAGAAMHIEHETHHALERAALIIEKEAKGEIGIYQGEVGQFAAWAELADATKDDRVKLGYSENEPGLRSGEMRDSIKHEIGHMEAAIGSDDENLVYFELGTSKQPPRSVLAGAAMRRAEHVALVMGSGFVMALVGEHVANRLMNLSKED